MVGSIDESSVGDTGDDLPVPLFEKDSVYFFAMVRFLESSLEQQFCIFEASLSFEEQSSNPEEVGLDPSTDVDLSESEDEPKLSKMAITGIVLGTMIIAAFAAGYLVVLARRRDLRHD